MIRFHQFSDVETWLNARPQFRKDGIRATDMRPAKIYDFCALLEHPERDFRVIHVAGTNGKGTTCSMIASIFAQSGRDVGLYTSPHVDHWRERIKINGIPASEAAILDAFRLMGKQDGFDQLTYFELTTIAAFLVFSRAKVKLAVIETGMGGRLDATNIVVPEVSVITSIGLDHTDYLGGDLASIAREKAGIIKPGVPVVIGSLPEEAEAVIRETATALNSVVYAAASLNPVMENGEITLDWEPEPITFIPDVKSVTSCYNAAMAANVVRLMRRSIPVNDAHLVEGLTHAARNTGLLARMEKLDPSMQWYYDGAHNTEALHVLIQNLRMMAPISEWTLVFTMMNDKAKADTVEVLKPFGKLMFYTAESERTATDKQISELFPDISIRKNDEIISDLHALTGEFVIFTGSFYFYNEVRRWIRMMSAFSD